MSSAKVEAISVCRETTTLVRALTWMVREGPCSPRIATDLLQEEDKEFAQGGLGGGGRAGDLLVVGDGGGVGFPGEVEHWHKQVGREVGRRRADGGGQHG